MPTKTYHIPSQTGSYYSPAGNVKIEIYYSDTATSNIDLDVKLLNIDKIKYQLEGDAGNQELKLAFTALEFFNNNNLFETSGVLNSAKKDETFIRIKLNGATFFDGKIIWNLIEKTNWFSDAGTLKYRNIKLNVVDKLVHMQSKKLASGIGYVTPNTVDQLFSKTATALGLTLNYQDNLFIQEKTNRKFGLRDDGSWTKPFKFKNITDQYVLDFLKKVCYAMGLFIYSQDGQLIVKQRDYFPTPTTIDMDKIIRIKKLPNPDLIDFIKVTCTKDWKAGFSSAPAEMVTNVLHEKTYGTESGDTQKNFVVDGLGVLDQLYVDPDGTAQVPSSPDFPDSYTNGSPLTRLNDISHDFYLDYIETGHIMEIYDWLAGTNVLNYAAPVMNVPTDTEIDFATPTAKSFTTSANTYQVQRNTATYPYIYKIELMVQKVASIYNTFFIGSDLIELQYADLWRIKNSFQLDGKNWNVVAAEYDIKRNITTIKARSIA